MHKERVKVLITEKPFRLKRAILDHPSTSPQPPGSSFQGSVVIRLPLRQAVDSVAFLAAKLLGAAQAHPAKQASTGFHHAQASAWWKMKMAKRVLMSC